MNRNIGLIAGLFGLGISACAANSAPIAGNCGLDDTCVSSAQALSVDKLDILLVVDNSRSVQEKLLEFKRELPNMLNTFVNGRGPQVGTFPPLDSVHVAVITTDMGTNSEEGEEIELPSSFMCDSSGDDGIFYRYGAGELADCDVTYPGFLSFEGGGAAVATVETVACVPALGAAGCGFEQPLEAALKSLSPASDTSVEFLHGLGHGDGENAGFLREDSLLVVVVITDEDDCSTTDPNIFRVEDAVSAPLKCFAYSDKLYDTTRYVDGIKNLRSADSQVMFVLVAGIPQELVGTGTPDAQDPDAYFDDILEDEQLQHQIRPDGYAPVLSCVTDSTDPAAPPVGAFAPRRLLEVAKGFGKNAVLGSICNDGFGTETGTIMRAVTERLGASEEAATASN